MTSVGFVSTRLLMMYMYITSQLITDNSDK